MYNVTSAYNIIYVQYFRRKRKRKTTSFKNFILLKYMSFTDDPPDRFSQFNVVQD